MTFVVTRQRAQEVHDLARARAGNRYGYGEAFTRNPRDSTDCSGLVLQTAAWYGGRTDWPGNRYGSTESFRLDHKIVYDLGFKRMPPGGPSALPFRPVMLVGLQHGGGGVNSHTACTLMTMDIPGGPVVQSERGVDWESRGGNPGVYLYDGARAWNDRLFHDFWYLDARLEGAATGPVTPPAAGGNQADILARATGITTQKATQILAQVVFALVKANCTTPRRIAAALAQWVIESGHFVYTEEIANGPETEERWKYKGRTWVQLTWVENYRGFSEWCHSLGLVPSPDYFVIRPRELADQKWAALGPAYWWAIKYPRINEYADRGDIDNVSKWVNAPAWVDNPNKHANHERERRDAYNRALALGDQLLTLIDSPTPADPWEEFLMLEVHSWSVYARPGEPKIPVHELIQALDAHGPHEPYWEQRARAGDLEAIKDLARVAVNGPWNFGLNRYVDDPIAKRNALNILLEIQAAHPEWITAATPGKA